MIRLLRALLTLPVALPLTGRTDDEGAPRIYWGDKPVIGTYHEGPGVTGATNILFRIGIEGRRHDGSHRAEEPEHHQWWINCLTDKPECTLKWIELDCILDTSISGSDCVGDVYSTYEGNLKVTRIDWRTGDLQFDLVGGVRQHIAAHVAMKMSFEHGMIHLESLAGHSDLDVKEMPGFPMPAMDYAVPKYTYAVAQPLRLRGWLSEGETKWEDAIRALSKQDQATWEQIKRDPNARRFQSDAEQKASADKLRRLLPDAAAVEAGKRKLTPAEEKILDKAVADDMLVTIKNWLARSGFSPAGQAKLFALLSKSVQSRVDK